MSIASELRERVRIEQQVTSNDGYGGKTVTWTELATVFAKVTPINTYAREGTVSDQVSAVAGYRVLIRARMDVTANMRLVWKTHTLSIHSLHEVETMLDILTYEENL